MESGSLERLDKAGQHGDRDRDVAHGKENGNNLGENPQHGGVDGVSETERLKHAPQAVIEVIAKRGHGNDVEERDGPDLETKDNVIVNIVLVKGGAGMRDAEGELQKVPNHESKDDGTAPNHGAGGVGGIEIGLLDVLDGPGRTLEEPEFEGRPNMQADGNKQGDPGGPQKTEMGFEERRVAIEFFGWLEDLEIAEQVSYNETEQDEAGHGHYRFLADGGLPEPQAKGREIHDSGTHGRYWSLCVP